MPATPSSSSWRKALVLVVILGALLRLGVAFLLIACALIEAWPRRWRSLGATIVIAGLVVSPWCLYSLARFGTPVPESGFATAIVPRPRTEVTGYREPARAILSRLPSGSVLGTMQNGAMAWGREPIPGADRILLYEVEPVDPPAPAASGS